MSKNDFKDSDFKERCFGEFSVNKFDMSFNVGNVTIEEEGIENLRKALKEYDKLNKRGTK